MNIIVEKSSLEYFIISLKKKKKISKPASLPIDDIKFFS